MTNSPVIPRTSLLRRFQKTLLSVTCLGIFFLWLRMSSNETSQGKPLIKEFTGNEVSEGKPLLKELRREHVSALKYILLWNAHDYAPLYYLGKKSEAFKKCPVSNCFVTHDRNFFKGNLTRFDAIAFNGRLIESYNRSNLPKERSPHQKYIYFNMESAANFVVCNRLFDNFFNWTSTYKLDSDIRFPYLLIKNTKGEEVGPKINMTWNVSTGGEDVARFKNKGVMWVASNCNTKNKREIFIRILRAELQSLHLSLDKYGRCGELKCPEDKCQPIVKNYSFYLSFENSIAEDYVTEKVYIPLVNGAVPVVLGGADYSRFLPPGSYLDATRFSVYELASKMVDIIENPHAYNEFFWWKKHYTYHRPESFENVCRLCAALNNRTMVETRTVYKDFRGWWYPKYVNECNARRKRANKATEDGEISLVTLNDDFLY